MHDQIKKHVERKREKTPREFTDPISSIQNLLGEECHTVTKTIESSDGTFIQYYSNGDSYYKVLSAEDYLKNIKTQFTYIIEELKSTGSSWKIKLIVCVVFEYDGDNKKYEA